MNAAEQYLYAHFPLPDNETTLEVEEAFQSFLFEIPDGPIVPKGLEEIVQRGFASKDIGLLLYVSECFRIDSRYRAYAKRFHGAEGYIALIGARAYAEAGRLTKDKEFRAHYFALAKKRCIEALEACQSEEILAKSCSFEIEETIRGYFFPCYLAKVQGNETEYKKLLRVLANDSGGARFLYALSLQPRDQVYMDIARGIHGLPFPPGTDYKELIAIHESSYHGKTRFDQIFHGIYLALSREDGSKALSILNKNLLPALNEFASGPNHAFVDELDCLYHPLYRLANIVGNIQK